MVDIAMCQHEDCPKSKECFRFMAIPDELQTYANFKNICADDGYRYFWAIGKNKIREEGDSQTNER
ncbi:MAG TPA: hypothetical protein PK924_07155 [Bacilli bacterium]|nr:hypothetical protein [Bacilli bacterium]